MINTVLGSIEKEKLGRTLCHEHVIINLSTIREDNDSELNDINLMANELTLCKKLGIDSLIEVTNIGMGRNVEKLKEISKKSNMNIIASTGFYTIPYYPGYIKSKTINELSQIMISEITDGIDGTNIKAGIIGEIGTSLSSIEDISLKVFDAAIIAHKETKVPISTHCEIGTMGYEQAIYLKKNKVDMSKVIIGHTDLVKDINKIIKILDTGANVGFDTIGKESYVSNESKAHIISKLVELGYENQILLSQDVTRKSYLKNNNSFGYVEVSQKFIPLLVSLGIKEDVINKFIIANPMKILDI